MCTRCSTIAWNQILKEKVKNEKFNRENLKEKRKSSKEKITKFEITKIVTRLITIISQRHYRNYDK